MLEPKNKPPGGGGEPALNTQEKQPAKTLEGLEKSDELLTPNELAALTGNTVALTPNVTFGGAPPESVGFSALHKGAAQLHGWAAHEHHGKEPFALTLKDYQAALKAAGSGLASHEPACSKHIPVAHKAAAEQAKKRAEELAKKGDK
ncbi:MAG: hypothetical protein ABFD89_17690 [Bryobacteraceae bacterium]